MTPKTSISLRISVKPAQRNATLQGAQAAGSIFHARPVTHTVLKCSWTSRSTQRLRLRSKAASTESVRGRSDLSHGIRRHSWRSKARGQASQTETASMACIALRRRLNLTQTQKYPTRILSWKGIRVQVCQFRWTAQAYRKARWLMTYRASTPSVASRRSSFSRVLEQINLTKRGNSTKRWRPNKWSWVTKPASSHMSFLQPDHCQHEVGSNGRALRARR